MSKTRASTAFMRIRKHEKGNAGCLFYRGEYRGGWLLKMQEHARKGNIVWTMG